MRIYSADDRATLHMMKLLNRWQSDRLLTEQESEQLREQTSSDLYTTNFFLRGVLFLFTAGILVLAQGLVILLFGLSHGTDKGLMILFLLSSAACYAAAEHAVREFRLFHFGIEEALVVCCVGFLFAGLQLHHARFRAGSDWGELLIMLVCAAVSVWIWYRFEYWYAFAAAMLFVGSAALCLTTSPATERILVAIFYAAGLAAIDAAGVRHRSYDLLRDAYSEAEALLWAGIYLSINLVPYSLLSPWLDGSGSIKPAFSSTFSWFTWVLIWCLPPMLIARAIRRKDRVLLALGAALAVATLVCNKSYLGWQRHPWDPMMLGVVLMGTAWSLQRWLALGAGSVRNGFTASRLAGEQSAWMKVGTSALSLVVPHAMSHHPQPSGLEVPQGGGGDSGGGGAGGTF